MIKYAQFISACAKRGVDGDRILLASLEKQAGAGAILRMLGTSVKSAPGKLFGKLKNWLSPTILEHIKVPAQAGKTLKGAYGAYGIEGSGALDSTRTLKKFRWDRLAALLGLAGAGGGSAYLLGKKPKPEPKANKLSPEAKKALAALGIGVGGTAATAALVAALRNKSKNAKIGE